MVHFNNAVTELRTRLNRTDNDLAELKNIQIEVKNTFIALEKCIMSLREY